MKNVNILFLRKGHQIADAETGKIVFEGEMDNEKSINAAKRESRRLQAMHHPYCVKVVDKFPKIDSGDKS